MNKKMDNINKDRSNLYLDCSASTSVENMSVNSFPLNNDEIDAKLSSDSSVEEIKFHIKRNNKSETSLLSMSIDDNKEHHSGDVVTHNVFTHNSVYNKQKKLSSSSIDDYDDMSEEKKNKQKNTINLFDCSFSSQSTDTEVSSSSKRLDRFLFNSIGGQPRQMYATQIDDLNSRAPLLPPDVMKIGNCFEYYKRHIDAFAEYKNNIDLNMKSNRSRRKYVLNSYHINFFDFKHVNIVDWNKTNDIDIAVKLHDNTITYIKVRKAPEELSDKVELLHKLLSKEKTKGNSRGKTGDRGSMFALGRRNEKQEYSICKRNTNVTDLMASIGKCRKTWFKKRFPEEYKYQFDDEPNLDYCRESLSDFMVHSISLGNSSHYDVNDVSMTTSTWVEESIGNTQNWFLVFPNVSVDSERATLIQLFHGCTICWDAYKLRHASSVPSYRLRGGYGTSGGNCELRRKKKMN